MSSIERRSPPPQPHDATHRQPDPELSSLELALRACPEERIDPHLGRGAAFRLGNGQRVSLELFPQVVRMTVPTGQIALPRSEAAVRPEGVVFQGEHHVLSVGPTGAVLFQYAPPDGERVDAAEAPTQPIWAGHSASTRGESAPPPSPAPEAREKPKGERYVGRLGEVRAHQTRAGKLVAEVDLTIADPDRPGASRLVKFAAFGEKAEALARDYQPGHEVTAVGIPHELRRRDRHGREWTERQLYFVQLPKHR
jgi:hypothetical protein